MTTGFARLPDAPAFRLTDLRVPACLIEGAVIPADRNGLARVDLTIADGHVTAIEPAGMAPVAAGPIFSLDGGIDVRTADLCARAGATTFVAGSAIFGSPDPAAAFREISAAAGCG